MIVPAIRFLLWCYSILYRIAEVAGPSCRPDGENGRVLLLTGTYFADNWIRSHLIPIAASSHCRRIYMVSQSPVPSMEKVYPLYPPKWLVSIFGGVPARLLSFLYQSLRIRPDIVGGFHLLFNGLVAAVGARISGGRSMYICVGSGPTEVMAVPKSENRIFKRMKISDPVVVKRLIDAVKSFDIVLTMGNRASQYFQEQGVRGVLEVVPGGIDGKIFCPIDETKDIDLLFVGRLVPVKRVDIFLTAVRIIRDRFPDVQVAVVGDGPLRGDLEQLALVLGIKENVTFAGHQANIEEWHRRSRIFVLTSESEGLSLSLMEAMMSGIPAVAPDVGDLRDVLIDKVNGYLVNDLRPESFAEKFLNLLADEEKRRAFSRAARESAERFGIEATTRRWDSIFSGMS